MGKCKKCEKMGWKVRFLRGIFFIIKLIGSRVFMQWKKQKLFVSWKVQDFKNLSANKRKNSGKQRASLLKIKSN